MLSRVADSIYWMSRYIERVENLARFIEVTLNLNIDLPGDSASAWQALVGTTGDHEYFNEHYSSATRENVIRFLTFDQDYPNSIRSCLYRARENARSVRETISSESWEQINLFYYMVREAGTGPQALESPEDFFNDVKMASHLFKGITDGTMSRGEGWQFARLGRLLERADKTSRILDVKYFMLRPGLRETGARESASREAGSSMDDLRWAAVLRSVSGFEMYRKRHHHITPRGVVDFLVLDREFPRAIQYCVESADECLRRISGTPVSECANVAEERLQALRQELSKAEVGELMAGDLHQFLDTFQTKLNGVGEGIYETFITLRPIENTVDVT